MTTSVNKVTSTALIVTEAAFAKTTMFLNGASQSVMFRDGTAPTQPNKVSQSVLVVTERAFGATDNFVTRVYQSVIRKDQDPAFINAASQSVLIVTEAPPGLQNVHVAQIRESTLIMEAGDPARVTSVSQAVLVVTDPAPPLTAVFPSSIIHQVMYVDPPPPVNISGVTNYTLVLIEGPVRSVDVANVVHQTLTADLDRGQLHVNGTSQQTLAVTEPKSRDPDRVRIITSSSAARKTFVDPLSIASLHRLRGLTTSTTVNKPYVDPLTLIPAYRLRNVSSSAVVSTPYPEKVQSESQTINLIQEVVVATQPENPEVIQSYSQAISLFSESAVAIPHVDPLSLRSPTNVSGLFIDVASSIAAADPSTLAAPQQVYVLTHSYASNVSFTPAAEIRSSARMWMAGLAAASSVEYQIPPQSSTVVNSYFQEVASGISMLDPTNEIFRPTLRVLRTKAEIVQAGNYADVSDIQSTAAAAQVAIASATNKTFDAPTLFRSRSQYGSLQFISATPSLVFGNPSRFQPGGRNYQVGIMRLHPSTSFGNMPVSSEVVMTMMVQAACEVDYGPAGKVPTSRLHLIDIMVANTADYPNPAGVKAKRRTSSVTVTRKAA